MRAAAAAESCRSLSAGSALIRRVFTVVLARTSLKASETEPPIDFRFPVRSTGLSEAMMGFAMLCR